MLYTKLTYATNQIYIYVKITLYYYRSNKIIEEKRWMV